jgi:uncharacterized repeat protein (TIGR02543 family)
MPATPAAHTFTAGWTNATTAAVTVNSASATGVSGAGSYKGNWRVTINAGTRTGNWAFTGWTVTSGGVTLNAPNSVETFFTMPATPVAVTVTANWLESRTVTVNGGGSTGSSGGGNYATGNIVTIYAGTRAGHIFNGWTVTGGATLANVNGATTTFVMPASGTPTLTATWRAEPSSGPTRTGAWPPAGGTTITLHRTVNSTGHWLASGTTQAGFTGATQTQNLTADGTWYFVQTNGANDNGFTAATPIIRVVRGGGSLTVEGKLWGQTWGGAVDSRYNAIAYNAANDQSRLLVNASGQYGVFWGTTNPSGWNNPGSGGSLHTVSVTNTGGSGHTGQGGYEAGDIVAINAGTPTTAGHVVTAMTATGGATITRDANNPSIGYFTMPAGNVTVTVTWGPGQTYALTRTAGSGGTITGTAAGNYAQGAAISLTAVPNAGQIFNNWTGTGISGLPSSNANLNFNMPAGAVSVTANFAPAPTFAVTMANNPTGGTLPTRTPTGNIAQGSTVNVTAGTRTGFTFVNWTSTPAGVSFANANAANTTFTMPGNAVTITANWAEIVSRDITMANAPTGGTLPTRTPSTNPVQSGTSVSINAGTRANHVFSHWTSTPAGVAFADANAASTTFPMVTTNVTVTANWLPTNNVTVTGGTASPANPVAQGATVTLTAGTPPANHVFGSWTVTGVAGVPNTNPATFTMPGNAVTATANWVEQTVLPADMGIFSTYLQIGDGDNWFNLTDPTVALEFDSKTAGYVVHAIENTFPGGILGAGQGQNGGRVLLYVKPTGALDAIIESFWVNDTQYTLAYTGSTANVNTAINGNWNGRSVWAAAGIHTIGAQKQVTINGGATGTSVATDAIAGHAILSSTFTNNNIMVNTGDVVRIVYRVGSPGGTPPTGPWGSTGPADPTVNWPSNLTAVYGSNLSSITLPNNGSGTPGTFGWVPAGTTLVGAVGGRSHELRFTPSDTTAFNTVTQNVSINVTARPLTWNAGTASNKVYNRTTAATVATAPTLSGVLAGDTVTVTAGTITFADANVGNGKAVTATGYSIGGASASNYTAPTAQPAFGTANITPLALTWNAGTANNKTVDGNATATVATAPTLSGVISPDVVTIITGTISFNNAAVGNNKPVTAVGYGITGAQAGNYSISGQPPFGTANITEAQTYVVTVVNGTGGGSFEANANVSVTAVAPIPGMVFVNWTITVGSPLTGFVTTNATTGFTMPARAVTLTANFVRAGAGFGDIDGDGVVDAADITLLRRYIAAENKPAFLAANPRFNLANALLLGQNSDSGPGAADIARLRQFVAGFSVTLGTP